MTHKLFFPSDTNPNDVTGGGGCVCSPIKQTDCKPPYLVFPGNDMENPQSPHVVACYECLRDGTHTLEGEILAAGEHMRPLEPEPPHKRGPGRPKKVTGVDEDLLRI